MISACQKENKKIAIEKNQIIKQKVKTLKIITKIYKRIITKKN